MDFIRSIMTPHPSSIQSSDNIQVAYDMIKRQKFRHLPVLDASGKLVGILSDRDLQRVMKREKVSLIEENYSFDSDEIVETVMSWPVKVISESTTIKTAARLMLQDKLSALVITDLNNKLMGIVTTDDFLRHIVHSEGSSDLPLLSTLPQLFT